MKGKAFGKANYVSPNPFTPLAAAYRPVPPGHLCGGCAQPHFRGDCPHAMSTCFACGGTGHIAACCRASEEKKAAYAELRSQMTAKGPKPPGKGPQKSKIGQANEENSKAGGKGDAKGKGARAAASGGKGAETPKESWRCMFCAMEHFNMSSSTCQNPECGRPNPKIRETQPVAEMKISKDVQVYLDKLEKPATGPSMEWDEADAFGIATEDGHEATVEEDQLDTDEDKERKKTLKFYQKSLDDAIAAGLQHEVTRIKGLIANAAKPTPSSRTLCKSKLHAELHDKTQRKIRDTNKLQAEIADLRRLREERSKDKAKEETELKKKYEIEAERIQKSFADIDKRIERDILEVEEKLRKLQIKSQETIDRIQAGILAAGPDATNGVHPKDAASYIPSTAAAAMEADLTRILQLGGCTAAAIQGVLLAVGNVLTAHQVPTENTGGPTIEDVTESGEVAPAPLPTHNRWGNPIAPNSGGVDASQQQAQHHAQALQEAEQRQQAILQQQQQAQAQQQINQVQQAQMQQAQQAQLMSQTMQAAAVHVQQQQAAQTQQAQQAQQQQFQQQQQDQAMQQQFQQVVTEHMQQQQATAMPLQQPQPTQSIVQQQVQAREAALQQQQQQQQPQAPAVLTAEQQQQLWRGA